jgi:hypothetical protein
VAQPIEERVQAVQLLLASLLDYLPTPVTSSGLIARSSLPGPAPGKRVPCGHCRRSGRIHSIKKSRICPVCEGHGWRARRRLNPSHPLYEQPYDEYTGLPVQADETQHPSAMSDRQLGAALEQLEYAHELRLGHSEGERYGWERERIAHDRQGSYRELRRSLGLLHRRWPVGYQQVHRVHFRGLSMLWNKIDRLLLDAAEEWVAREMRGPVRVPPWLQERRAADRQKTIQELTKEGLSAGQIARVLRIPKAKVKRLLAGTGSSRYSPGEQTLPGESERVRT